MTSEVRKHTWALALQRAISLSNRIWLVPAAYFYVRVFLYLRCGRQREVRKIFFDLQAMNRSRPILLCSNHLTLIDSLLICCFLNPWYRYVVESRSLPWSVPEADNFKRNRLIHALCYIGKSIFVQRLGTNESKSATMEQLREVLLKGEIISIFPEGGRSRTGQIELENCAYGVGNLVLEIPECRVICVYLRGRRQNTYSNFPKFGDTIDLAIAEISPKSAYSGRRGSREITLQIMTKLKEMEHAVFAGRE